MCYSYFPLLSFCYRTYWSVNPWGTRFTWLHPHWVAFQFNQEPSWLPRYRHLTFSRFVSLNHAQIQIIMMTERLRHHPQNIGAGHTFLSFIPSTWNSNLKILATTGLQRFHGMANSSLELLLTVCPKQSVTQLRWISVLISHQPTICSKTET